LGQCSEREASERERQVDPRLPAIGFHNQTSQHLRYAGVAALTPPLAALLRAAKSASTDNSYRPLQSKRLKQTPQSEQPGE
jgi:hypothetical protein